jgi:uncharacterized protein YegP (UPF0339 family)
MKGDYFASQESKSCKTYSFRIKAGNVQMIYFQEVLSHKKGVKKMSFE